LLRADYRDFIIGRFWWGVNPGSKNADTKSAEVQPARRDGGVMKESPVMNNEGRKAHLVRNRHLAAAADRIKDGGLSGANINIYEEDHT
jgi:hypothetical protein